MRAALISEGRDDQAVLRHILKAQLGMDGSRIRNIRPDDQVDESDRARTAEAQMGGISRVFSDCENDAKIQQALNTFLGPTILILQVDSAECEEFEIPRPDKPKEPAALKAYSTELRSNIIDELNNRLGENQSDSIYFAVAMEETEAWVLAHYDTKTQESAKHGDPKVRLNRHWNQNLSQKDKKYLSRNAYTKFLHLAKPLSKSKNLNAAMERNQSLKEFVESLPEAPAK